MTVSEKNIKGAWSPCNKIQREISIEKFNKNSIKIQYKKSSEKLIMVSEQGNNSSSRK